MVLPGMTLVGSEEDERRYYLQKRLREATTAQVLTAEEARLLGMDISGVGEDWLDWMVKLSPDETRDAGMFASYVSPEGYEFGEDMSVRTPEGVQYTEEEWRIETGQLEEIEMGPPAAWQKVAGREPELSTYTWPPSGGWAPPGAPSGVVVGGPSMWQAIARQELETILETGELPQETLRTFKAMGYTPERGAYTEKDVAAGKWPITPSERQQVQEALKRLEVEPEQVEAERIQAVGSRVEGLLAEFTEATEWRDFDTYYQRIGRAQRHQSSLSAMLEQSGLTAEQRMRVLAATKVPLVQRDPGGRLITTPLQLLPPEQHVSTLLRQYVPSITFPAEDPWAGLAELGEIARTDPGIFIAWIREKGMSEDLKQLVWAAVPEATKEDIDLYFGSIQSQVVQEVLAPIMPELFPGLANVQPEVAVKWITDNQTEFMERVHGMGQTAETEALLRAFYPSLKETEIAQFFKEDTRGWFGKLWGSLVGGVGTIYGSVGWGLEWLGGLFKYMGEPAAGFGEFLSWAGEVPSAFGGVLQKELPRSSMGWSFVSQVPMQVVLLSTGLGGLTLAARAAARAGITTATRLGAFANYTIKITGFTAASRSLESFMEAGGAYEQAIAQGMSRDEASGVAGEVFRKNLALAGVDFLQFSAMFMPFASFKLLPSLFEKGLLRVVKPAAGVGFVSAAEGFEEYYQEIVQNQALGVDVKFWELTKNLSEEEYRQVFMLGAMWGGVLATGANVMSVIARAVPANLPADLQADFNKAKADGVRQGMGLQEAEMAALDKIAETPGGKKAIDDVMEAVRVEWYRGQIRPETAPEATVWNNRLNDMRPEGIVGIPPGTVQVRGEVRAELGAREPYAEYAARLKSKYAGLPEAEAVSKIAVDIGDAVPVTPAQVDSFLKKLSKAEAVKHISGIESAIADRTGDVIATYRYESVQEGQDYEAYLDSLLKVTQKYRQKHGMALTMKPEEVTVPAAPAAPAVKEELGVRQPWQMTREEFISAVREGLDFEQLGVSPTPLPTLREAKDYESLDKQAATHHEGVVSIALSEGKPVPAEVLADYPGLQVAKPTAAAAEIPGLPSETITEVGQQVDIFGKVTRVAPAVKGKLTQIKMEDWAELERYKGRVGFEEWQAKVRKEAVTVEPLDVSTLTVDEKKLAEGLKVLDHDARMAFWSAMNSRIEELAEEIRAWTDSVQSTEEFLATDPVATYRGHIGKRVLSLMSLLRRGKWPETLTQAETLALLKFKRGTELPSNVLTPEGRVKWEYVIDEVREQFGMEEQAFIEHIEFIAAQKAQLTEMKGYLRQADESSTNAKRAVELVDFIDKQPFVEIPGVTQPVEVKPTRVIPPVEREGEPVKLMPSKPVQAVEDAKVKPLRQTIMSWAHMKGLPESQYRKLFMEAGGHRQLHLMKEEQLQKTLEAIKKARPVAIKGKHIITAKTEKKIASLKDTLIGEKKLTQASFDRLLRIFNLPTIKYESQYRFITEKEGKALIRAMNDEAPLVAWDIKVEESLAANPKIQEQWKEADLAAKGETDISIAGEPVRIRRFHEGRSMRYYTMKLQREMAAPIYDIWQKINMAHLVIHKKQQGLLQDIIDSVGKDEFKAIRSDEKALKRVEDYIASKHKTRGFKKPADITASEVAMAEEIERQLFGFRNDVRYARFTEAYAGHAGDLDGIVADIPDAPREALRHALDTFEAKGSDALRAYLDTQEWGVIRSGYEPLSVVKPHLHLFKARATSFAKGHIQTREGTSYEQQETTILDRYRSYSKQMMGLTDLAPLIRSLDRVFTENAGRLKDPGHAAAALSKGINELKGYHEEGGWGVHLIERLYGQVAAATFWRPDLVLRNKFQNWAFNPDFHMGLVFHPKNKWMSAERRAWFEIFIVQDRGIIQDFLFRHQKPIPGFGRVVRLANRTSLFPWSDKSNRAEAYFVRMNRVDRALARYRKDGNVEKLVKDSGLVDLEARQQAEALELLAMDTVDYGVPGMPAVTGQEAFARYNAQQLVNNVHFLYDRAQRSPAEMGATGRTIGNIMTFQRSWAERLILQANALRPGSKASFAKRLYAAQVIVGVIVVGLIAGQTYKKVTGKRQNPYNPLNILTYTPGGLMIGVTEDISNVIYLALEAAQGNKFAMGKLPAAITQAADLVVPFYKNFWQALEAGMDKKYLDMDAVRRIRELLDDDYTRNRNATEVDRNLVETLQHALLGGVAPPQTLQEKLADAEERLGELIEDEDLLFFSVEDPEVYGMGKLSSAFNTLLKGESLDGILVADYSPMVKAWAEKEQSEREWIALPNLRLYQINADPEKGPTWDEYYRQWEQVKGLDWQADYPKAKLGNISRRQYDLLQQYHALPEDEQEAFLGDHPEISVNPAEEWLRSHPDDNARLVLWAQGKLLTEDAYNKLQGMMRELDIRDDLVPGIPPKNVAPAYFEYQDILKDFAAGSSEVLLFRLEHEDFQKWGEKEYQWSMPENNPEVLRVNVKYRDEDTIYDSLPPGGERQAYLIENPEYAEARIRRKAYEEGIPDKVIDTYVEYVETGFTGNERLLWLMEHKEFYYAAAEALEWTQVIPEEWADTMARFLRTGYRGEKRQRWLFVNRGFYEAVKDIMNWGPLERQEPGVGVSGELPGMTYVSPLW